MRNQVILQVVFATLLAVLAGMLTGPDLQVLGVPALRVYDLIGKLFLNALTLVVVPLVASSIITGTARVGGDKEFGRIGRSTLALFVGTGLLAVAVGTLLTLWVQPGFGVDGQALTQGAGSLCSIEQVQSSAEGSVFDRVEQILFRLVPSNILAVATEGQMLGLILFSLVFGFYAARIDSDLSAAVIRFWRGTFEVMMKMTQLVMRGLPLGVFGLMAKVVVTTGMDAVRPVILFFLTDIAGMLILSLVIYPLLLWLLGGLSPLRHMGKMMPALVTAFSTSSTAASLPVTMDCAEERAGVPNSVCSFTLPLGVSLNLTGTALHACVAVLFITQAYGIELETGMLVTIVLMGLFTSLGMVAGVPSGSLVTIVVILQTLGLPTEGIVLILAVERLLDMCRTTVSVWGNSCCAVLVARYAKLN